MNIKLIKKSMLSTFVLGMTLTHSGLSQAEKISTFNDQPPNESLATTGGEKYSANFRDTDIKEFINTIGKNLERTIIFDPSVRGKVTVRSYVMLDDEAYYQVFLNVLEVNGYAVVDLPNNVLKVIKSKKARTSAIPLASDDNPGQGDEMVTRIVPVYNVSVRKLAPILRQLTDNAGGGHAAPYEPANVLMITGRAASVERLIKIVKRIDLQGDTEAEVVQLSYASASDLVRIIQTLSRAHKSSLNSNKHVNVVADERTNSIIVTAARKERARIIRLIHRLDGELESRGNTQVIHMKYAKAEDIVDVLTGYAKTLTDKAQKSKGKKASGGKNKITIVAHKETNSLVITAEPKEMATLKSVIKELDIPRLQIFIEAIIVKVNQSDGLELGLEFGAGPDSGAFTVSQGVASGPRVSDIGAGIWGMNNGTTSEKNAARKQLFDAAGTVKAGIAAAFRLGDWTALLKASATDNRSDLLATPQVMTLDNAEAEFFSGKEVSIKKQTDATNNSSSPYSTTYDRQKVGMTLKVTPQVVGGGSQVKLVVEQKSSSSENTSDNDQTIAEQHINTSIVADSRQIIMIGGLIQEQEIERISKIPFLGDIPIIGELFTSTSQAVEKGNLVVFIRPTIVQDARIMQTLTGRKYNYIRALQINMREDLSHFWQDKSEGTLLQPWDTQSTLPVSVQKVLDKYPQRFPLDTTPAINYINPEQLDQVQDQLSEEDIEASQSQVDDAPAALPDMPADAPAALPDMSADEPPFDSEGNMRMPQPEGEAQ